jgi:sugar transferase (PEP-CTERM system associated)
MLKIGGQKVPTSILFLLGIDAGLVILGELIAVFLRFPDSHSTVGFLSQPGAPFRVALVMIISMVALYYNDLYTPQNSNQKEELFLNLLQALGMACLGLALVYYAIPNWALGRGIAVLAAPIIFFSILGGRLFLGTSRLLFQAPQRVLVVGTSAAGISLVKEILARPEMNLKVVGFLDERGENIGKSLVNPCVIGAVSDMGEIVAREKIDQVILAVAERRGGTPVGPLLQLKFAGVGVTDTHAFDEKMTGRILLENLSPSWLIFSEGFRKSQLVLAVKSVLDFAIAAFGFVVTLPIMLLVALAIWLETGSPILFRQERVGLRGHSFEIFKFRSMRQNAEENGPSWAAHDDDRVTGVGRFIRKMRLDELPQLWNVLRGEMSLVGPRPERPFFCSLLEENIPLFVLRHSVRPGITGWAQIKYQYGSSVAEAKTKLEYDFFYIKHLSLVLDLAIILETVKVVLSGRGAK